MRTINQLIISNGWKVEVNHNVKMIKEENILIRLFNRVFRTPPAKPQSLAEKIVTHWDSNQLEAVDVKMLELWYKSQFPKTEYMPWETFNTLNTSVRRLGAKLLALKLFPEAGREDFIAFTGKLVDDPSLHHFLRTNFMDKRIQKFRAVKRDRGNVQSDVPEVEFKEGKVMIPVEINRVKTMLDWKEFSECLYFANEKKPTNLPNNLKPIARWNEGEMRNCWLGSRGLKMGPDKEMVDKLRTKLKDAKNKNGQKLYNQVLGLLQMGLIEAETFNDESITFPYLEVIADADPDKAQTGGIHGYFALNIPDGKGNVHRFVMGKELKNQSFRTHEGRFASVDLRFYRHFSGNKELTRIKIPDGKLVDLFKVILHEVNDSNVYSKLENNCCNVVERLLCAIDVKWDSKLHILDQVTGGILGRDKITQFVLGILFNIWSFFNGRGKIESSLLQKGKVKYLDVTSKKYKEYFRVPLSWIDYLKPSRAIFCSPRGIALRCREVNRYRKCLEKQCKNKEELEDAKWALPPAFKMA